MIALPYSIVPRPEDFQRRGNPQWRQQAIRFLMASIPELDELVNKALDCNPLLERVGPPALAIAEPMPDVTVAQAGDEFVVHLNSAPIPQVRLRALQGGPVEAEKQPREVRRLKGRESASARFVIRCLCRRQETIYKVACEIVRRQRDFFEHGLARLKPLNQVEVARAIGFTQATVGRAVRHKSMQTPHGPMEFKSFFSQGYETAAGDSVTCASVKGLVAQYISQEDPGNPLSDLELTQRLTENGLPLARRTVAKYRISMGIPSSRLRRSDVRKPPVANGGPLDFQSQGEEHSALG